MSTLSTIVRSELTRKLTLTYYSDDKGPKRPVMVYCHTFTGNKLEAKFLLEKHLDKFVVCMFDFRGCGNSNEEYVTLGIREKFDLTFVLRILDDVLKPSAFYLWGRSMGAVTIIHYLTHQQKLHRKKQEAMNDPNAIKRPGQFAQIENDYAIMKKIRAVVLDSPFADSYRMVLDVMKNNMNIPSTLGKVILLPVQNSIKNNVKFDVLSDNKPVKMCQKLTVPALFMIGENDTLVNPTKFTKMFENYAGEHKKLRLLAGTDHSDFRNDVDIEFAFRFLFEIEDMAPSEYKREIMKRDVHFEKEDDNRILKQEISTKEVHKNQHLSKQPKIEPAKVAKAEQSIAMRPPSKTEPQPPQLLVRKNVMNPQGFYKEDDEFKKVEKKQAIDNPISAQNKQNDRRISDVRALNIEVKQAVEPIKFVQPEKPGIFGDKPKLRAEQGPPSKPLFSEKGPILNNGGSKVKPITEPVKLDSKTAQRTITATTTQPPPQPSQQTAQTAQIKRMESLPTMVKTTQGKMPQKEFKIFDS